jgi:hypothetical protein
MDFACVRETSSTLGVRQAQRAIAASFPCSLTIK